MSLSDLLATTVGALEAEGVPYMLTGSVVSSMFGEPRSTRDLDVVIDPSPAGLEALVGRLRRSGMYVDLPAARAALGDRGQFNAVSGAEKVDFLIRKDHAFARAEFERRRRVPLGAQEPFVVSPEDLILTKLVWTMETGSEQHRRDVAGMVAIGEPDRAYVRRWATRLGVRALWDEIDSGEPADR